MALFEFELARVEDITPWGDPGNQTLSWFALTDGFFRVVVGDQVLFRYTDEILSHWGERHRDAGYQVAAFARDMLGSVAAGAAELPDFVERLAADWDLLTRLQAQAFEREDLSGSVEYESTPPANVPVITPMLPSSIAGEFFTSSSVDYTAWRWVGERSPWTSYLVAQPGMCFVRIGDELRIHWDNRDRVIDGMPVWTASRGVFVLSVETFLSECRDFATRLLVDMAARIRQIEAGEAQPQIAVDVASLRLQQEEWRAEFESCFRAHQPDVPWDDAAAAIRAIANRGGIELPM